MKYGTAKTGTSKRHEPGYHYLRRYAHLSIATVSFEMFLEYLKEPVKKMGKVEHVATTKVMDNIISFNIIPHYLAKTPRKRQERPQVNAALVIAVTFLENLVLLNLRLMGFDTA